MYLHTPPSHPRTSLLECPFSFLKVKDCTDIGSDKVSPHCLCACVCVHSFQFQAGETERWKSSGALGFLALLHTEQNTPFRSLNLGLDTPCWWFALPCPSKAVATLPTLVSNFLCFSIRNMHKKNPLGKTVKVLLSFYAEEEQRLREDLTTWIIEQRWICCLVCVGPMKIISHNLHFPFCL